MQDRHVGRQSPVFDLSGDPERFISLIRNAGPLSRVMRARACPCNSTGTPDIHCDTCKGRGYIYDFQRRFLQPDEDSDQSRDGSKIYPLRVPLLEPLKVERLACEAQGGILEFAVDSFDSTSITVTPGDDPIKHYSKLRVSYYFDRFETVVREKMNLDIFNQCMWVESALYNVQHGAGSVFNVSGDLVHLSEFIDGYNESDVSNILTGLGDYSLRQNKVYFENVDEYDFFNTILYTCVSKFNAHCGDTDEHVHADTANIIEADTCPLPEPTEETLCSKVAELITKYTAHHADALKNSDWSYHSGKSLEDNSLSDVTAPTNYYECAVRLTDYISKFDKHDIDSVVEEIEEDEEGEEEEPIPTCHLKGDLHRFYYLLSYSYCPPTNVLVADIEQSNNKTEKWSEGMYEGDCKMSLEPWYELSEGDIITLLTVILYKNELITHTAENSGDLLFEFDISSLSNDIIDESGNKYYINVDYVLSDRRILWKESGSSPAEGKKFSIRYGYHPTYIVFRNNAQPNAMENKMYPVTVFMKSWSKIKKGTPERRIDGGDLWQE